MVITHCEFCDEALVVPASREVTDPPVACESAECKEELAEILRARGITEKEEDHHG